MVYQVVNAVSIPVIGVGGIVDYRDALQFLIAGAKAIQVGTANFVNPKTTLNIIDGIKTFCAERRISQIDEIIGSLRIIEPP